MHTQERAKSSTAGAAAFVNGLPESPQSRRPGKPCAGAPGEILTGDREGRGAGPPPPPGQARAVLLHKLAGVGGCRYHTRPFGQAARSGRQHREKYMASYTTSEVRGGLKVLLDGDPYAVIENEFVKPGKGQAFNRIKVRNLKTGRTIEKTFRSGESLEGADVVDTEMQFLYQEGDFWNFMQPESFEQYTADKAAVGDAAQWLKDGTVCIITLWNNVPLVVTPPPHIELKIIETDPGLRGDTATGGQKSAKVETGAVIRVPLFLNEGEVIRIDTRTGEYVSRAK